MTNFYQSKFYDLPIEVDNIWWEVIVTITDSIWRKLIYSWYDLIAKNSTSKYITKCILWWLIRDIPKKILIIWFWGWAFAKYIEDHIKNANITWIDIDETMFQIAKKELDIKTNNLILMDWQEAIKELINKKETFDLILLDVYWSDWRMPENFDKKEIYVNIKKILNNEWIFSINYADYSWLNVWKYNKIHYFLKEIFWENFVHIKWEKNNNWNISWIYNLDKNYEPEEINLKYLEKVKNWDILYDSNMIKNTII